MGVKAVLTIRKDILSTGLRCSFLGVIAADDPEKGISSWVEKLFLGCQGSRPVCTWSFLGVRRTGFSTRNTQEAIENILEAIENILEVSRNILEANYLTNIIYV